MPERWTFKTPFWPEQSISQDRVNAGLNGSRASGSLGAFFCFSLLMELAGHNPCSFSSFSHESPLYLPYILPTDCKEQDIHEEMSVRPMGQPPVSNTPRDRHLCSANEAPGPWTLLPRVLFCSCGFSPAPWHQMKRCHVAPHKAACMKTEDLLLGTINCCSLRGEVQVRKLRSGAGGF